MPLSGSLLGKVRGLVGAPYVLLGVDRSPYVVEGRTPEAVILPGSPEEVAGVVALAAEARVSVTPWGGGTKMLLGTPPQALGIVLGLSRLNRLLEHEPGDLTATVQAGMKFAAFQSAVADKGQWFSLDPADAERATLGGIIAANASGPRRHLYGTARDLVIGMALVTGEGRIVRAGGKVVKNVAGYDLPKLFIGCLGTLGVITELTVKLRPLPDDDRALWVSFPTLAAAAETAHALTIADLIPHSLELLDSHGHKSLARALGRPTEDGAALLVGFDGLSEAVAWQLQEADRLCQKIGRSRTEELAGEDRERAWEFVRHFPREVFPEAALAIKVGILPSQCVPFIEQAAQAAESRGLRAAFSAHASLGLIVAALAASPPTESRAQVVCLREWRRLAGELQGHLLVESAPLAIKEEIAVWDPPGPAFRIMERLKAQLDPYGILNPGRFVGGL